MFTDMRRSAKNIDKKHIFNKYMWNVLQERFLKKFFLGFLKCMPALHNDCILSGELIHEHEIC